MSLEMLINNYANLADPILGAKAVACSDEFFAPMARIMSPEDPVFIPGKYDDHGKWMDGWETRRLRGIGHDWMIIKLGQAARLKAAVIDTRHFTGNFAPAASLEGCSSREEIPGEGALWRPLLKAVDLGADAVFQFPVDDIGPVTHVRLNIFPDGGVARLRLHGQADIDWSGHDGSEIDLAAIINGGRPIAAIDEHFGRLGNILKPGRGVNMGDGWETRRRREPGRDWAIIALGTPGIVNRILVDTCYFKGNYPASVALQAAYDPGATEKALPSSSHFWPTLMKDQPLNADAIHEFKAVEGVGPVSHVRINIFPDGGISRLRVMGIPHKERR